MNKYEYRVVWKRRGMDRKSKRYATLPGAKNRVLLMGPEPWLAFKEDPDEKHCCSGYECGCGGETWRDYLLRQRQEANGMDPDGGPMPPLEYMRIERRALSPWEEAPPA